MVILIYINLSIFLKEKKAQLQSNTLEPCQVHEADKIKKKDIEKDLKIETLIKEVEDDKIDLIEYVSEQVSKLFHFRINKKDANKINIS